MKSLKPASSRYSVTHGLTRSVGPAHWGGLTILVLLASLLLAACGDSTATSAPAATTASATTAASTTAAAAGTTSAAAGSSATTAAAFSGSFDGTIKFGAPLSLTGSLNNESKQTQMGYDLWKETTNAKGGIVVGGKHYQIDIKYYDDASKQDVSATLATKLINEDKVNFLLGPYGTSSTNSVATIAEQNEIPMVEGNGAAESIFTQGRHYTFGVLSPGPKYLQGVIDMALAQNPKPQKIAILAANDSFSKEVGTAAKNYATSKGMTVVLYEEYPNAETNLTAQVTKAKAQNPDLLLNSGHYAEATAIIKAAKELGLNPMGYGFSVGPGLPEWGSSLKKDGDYVFGGSQWTSAVTYKGDDVFGTSKNFYDMFVKKYNVEPAYQAADGAACGIAFQKAIEKAGTLDPKKVRDALASLDITTFYGQIKFDERGINIYKPMVVEQWQDGKKVTVWPADVASAKPQWPVPAWDKR
ncbi:MAG TPA: amino acid ABC transporter substrate-binding protein [Chloroflexia bacterium]|nr:amino acid ABC transporter substrate-binding protein [Chloroflexia bacterium]